MARPKVDFRLDTKKEDEAFLYRWVGELKAMRKWSSTVRNALKLFYSLSQGRTDVLEEMFPFAVQKQQSLENSQFEQLVSLLSAQTSMPTIGYRPPSQLPRGEMPSFVVTESEDSGNDDDIFANMFD